MIFEPCVPCWLQPGGDDRDSDCEEDDMIGKQSDGGGFFLPDASLGCSQRGVSRLNAGAYRGRAASGDWTEGSRV